MKSLEGLDPLVLVGAQIYTTVRKLLFENLSPIDIDELNNDLMEVSLRGLLE